MTKHNGAQSKPAVIPPAVTSPEILPDNQVIFRIYAPAASAVTIEGDWNTQGRGTGDPLQKDEQGIWSITVHLEPDFYIYSFTVDGVRTLDPANTWIKPGSLSVKNLVEVPGPKIAFSSTQPVPHGDVRIVWYDSPTIGAPRRMHVYTPPGYDSSAEDYPVLYLIHGGGDDDAAWHTVGRAGFILDNLIADGLVKPMIIVMPNGKIDVPGFTFFLSDEDKKSPAAVQKRIDTISYTHDTFVKDLLTTIIPTIEDRFRVKTDRVSRALAGLSMGGAETLRAAPSHLDLFAYIGVFSMGLQTGFDAGINNDFEERNAAFFTDPDKTNDLVKLFYVASGENDEIVTDGPRRLSETLSRHGIVHEFHETSGGHTWINWRRYLYDFAQKLFR